MRIAIGSDHAGFALKQHLTEQLRTAGHEVLDLGTDSTVSVDYPDYGRVVGAAVADGKATLGVAICGSGIGISIAANRVRGARCARCTSEWDARFARLHNDANVLALGARCTGVGMAEAIVETFLNTAFEGGRHAQRVEKLSS
jgi:ribose 5-phosphate isomerase B